LYVVDVRDIFFTRVFQLKREEHIFVREGKRLDGAEVFIILKQLKIDASFLSDEIEQVNTRRKSTSKTVFY
jgi:hypothetical protein